MRKGLVLSLVLVGIIISGCVEQDVVTPEYHDEALKIETEVTGEVLPSQGINLKVRLVNQVPDIVKDVKFKITDLYGLQIVRRNCANGVVKSYGCDFPDGIQSLDDREINFVLKVPTKEELARIGRELKPELTLEYIYFGETTFLIPILGLNERSTDAKSQLIQTKGPVHVDIKRGFTESKKEWEWNGSGFSVVIRFEDVLTSESQVTIDKDKIDITLDNLYTDPQETFGRCDFDFPTSSHPNYKLKENVTLPMTTPILCALEGDSKGMPWVYGQVRVKYDDYRYKAVETKSIQVETVII